MITSSSSKKPEKETIQSKYKAYIDGHFYLWWLNQTALLTHSLRYLCHHMKPNLHSLQNLQLSLQIFFCQVNAASWSPYCCRDQVLYHPDHGFSYPCCPFQHVSSAPCAFSPFLCHRPAQGDQD